MLPNLIYATTETPLDKQYFCLYSMIMEGDEESFRPSSENQVKEIKQREAALEKFKITAELLKQVDYHNTDVLESPRGSLYQDQTYIGRLLGEIPRVLRNASSVLPRHESANKDSPYTYEWRGEQLVVTQHWQVGDRLLRGGRIVFGGDFIDASRWLVSVQEGKTPEGQWHRAEGSVSLEFSSQKKEEGPPGRIIIRKIDIGTKKRPEVREYGVYEKDEGGFMVKPTVGERRRRGGNGGR